MINDVQKGPGGVAEEAVGVKAEEVEAAEGVLIHLVVLIEAMVVMVVIYYLRINPMIGPP